MRKIFTFLLALVASVGMMNAKVTWNSSNISNLYVAGTAQSFSMEGVTLSANSDVILATWDDGIAFYTYGADGYTFSNTLGKNFKKIEMFPISSGWAGVTLGSGWSSFSGENGDPVTWEGNASTVDLLKDVSGFNDEKVNRIVFYFEGDPNSITINGGIPQVGDNSISLTYYFDPDNVPGLDQGFAPTLKVKCVTDNKWDEIWLSTSEISSGTTTITLDELVSFQAGKQYDVCFAYNNGGWVDDVFQSFTPATPAPVDEHITANEDPKNTGVYYSTFFDSANKYALPADVEAYVAEVSSNALNLTKIAGEGQTIPADNAVILKSSVDQFTLSISDAAPVSFTATNNLHGVNADTEIASVVSGTCYVLSGNSTDGVGFFVYKAPNQLQAHKAYIDLNGSGMAQAPKRMPFVFNGEQTATGVENVQGNVQSTKVIENGVLFIIKNGVKYNAMGQEVK